MRNLYFMILLATGVISIGVIECFALSKGINGNGLGISTATIGVIIGYAYKHYSAKYDPALDRPRG